MGLIYQDQVMSMYTTHLLELVYSYISLAHSLIKSNMKWCDSYLSFNFLKNIPGDDCVAINNGSVNINITRMNCGPGHGIRYICV